MSLEHEREKWLQDLEQRQRNILFPDTRDNGARFWQDLFNKKNYTIVQWVGIALMCFLVLGIGVATFLGDPLDKFSWQNIFGKIFLLLIVGLFLGAFLMAMSWSISRDARLRDKIKKEEVEKKQNRDPRRIASSTSYPHLSFSEIAEIKIVFLSGLCVLCGKELK